MINKLVKLKPAQLVMFEETGLGVVIEWQLSTQSPTKNQTTDKIKNSIKIINNKEYINIILKMVNKILNIIKNNNINIYTKYIQA